MGSEPVIRADAVVQRRNRGDGCQACLVSGARHRKGVCSFSRRRKFFGDPKVQIESLVDSIIYKLSSAMGSIERSTLVLKVDASGARVSRLTMGVVVLDAWWCWTFLKHCFPGCAATRVRIKIRQNLGLP